MKIKPHILFCCWLLYAANCSSQSISGGTYLHSIARCTDSLVMAWGDNSAGQIGDNTTITRSSPVQVLKGAAGSCVTYLCGITAVGAGRYFSLSVKNNNSVFAWGDNFYGQLGDNTTTTRLTPVKVLTGASPCATYLCNIKTVSGGDYHTLALKSDSTVWAWGDNGSFGKLGINITTAGSTRKTPVQVLGPGGVGTLTGITAISAGGIHSLALKNDGTVWAWGYNGQGELGDNTITKQPAPVQVVGAGGSGNLTNIIAIAGGNFHSLALDNSGNVWAWGANIYGCLGDGTTNESHFPVQVSGLTNIIAISAGQYISFALKNDGTVWAWGDNTYGQLGNNNVPTESHVPVQVKGAGGAGFLTGIIAIDAGQYHGIALKNDQTVWTWGDDFEGQLGDNQASTQVPFPVQAGSGGGNTLCNVTLLPVELISFSADCHTERSEVSINWSTASEINNNYFEVERSSDGKIFEKIGKVNGAGNSSTIRNYEFVDVELPTPNSQLPTIYYRLKQTDYDGKFEYYGPISVQCEPNDEWNLIVQNIFSDEELKGTLFSPDNSEVNLSIMDLQGRIIKQEKINTVKGANYLQIDLKNISSGIYFLKVYSGEKQVTKKIIKL